MKDPIRDLEFAISRYLDGTLDQQECAELELRLAEDAAAREMLAEQRRLTDFLRDASPVPLEIRWVCWRNICHRLSPKFRSRRSPTG